MKKRKLLITLFATIATFAFAVVGASCGIKDKLEEWTCNHVYNDGVVTKVQTCTETGEKVYTCLDCGKQKTESISLSEHIYNVGVITTDPTCTDFGVRTQMCVDCGQEKTVLVDKVAHTPVTVSAVAPTCTTAGYCEWEYCEVCTVVLAPKVQSSAALGHTEVIDEAVAATCTTTGKTAGRHCGTCGEIIVAQTVVQALGHSPVPLSDKTPTCTETGLKGGSVCNVCNTVLVAQTEIAMIDHIDTDFSGYCDGCEAFMETIGYTVADLSSGENKIANTWYRVYDNYDGVNASYALCSIEECSTGDGMHGAKTLQIILSGISLAGINHDADFVFEVGDGLTVVRGDGYYDFCFKEGATFTTVGSDLEAQGYPCSFTVTITDDLHWDITNIDLEHFKRLDVPDDI